MSTVAVAGPTGTSMRGLLSAQLLKLRTRAGLILLGVNVLVPLALLVLILLVGQQTFDLTGADLARPLTDTIGNSLLLTILVAVVVAADHRHGTIVPTLLGEPRRLRVALSAMLAPGLVAVAVSAACALLGAAIALPWLAAQGVPVGEVLADPDLWWRTLGQIAVMVATALTTAALAMLLRNALGAIAAFVGYQFAEGFYIGLTQNPLPWGLTTALERLSDPTAPGMDVPLWQPVLVLVAVLTAVVAAALFSTARRDAA